MAVATFDTLKFANTLKEAGVPPQQAEAQATAFADILQINFRELVTKDDLTAAKEDLRNEIKQTELRLDAKMDRLDAKIDRLETRIYGDFYLLKWMFGAILAAFETTLTLVIRLLMR